jgi:WD40 repeat protein
VLRGHTDAVTALAFSPDGGTLASAGRDGSIRLWSLADGKETSSLNAEKSQINALAFSPDGTLLAAGNVELRVRLFDVATGAVKREFAFADAVLEVAFSPDGATLAVAGPSGNATLFSVADGKALPVKVRGRSLRFSADGKTLALGQPGGGITLVDPRDGRAKKTISTGAHLPILTMSASGALIATWNAKERAIRLWNGASGKAQGELVLAAPRDLFEDAQLDTVTSLAMTPDGRFVVSATADRQLRVWSVEQKKIVETRPLERGGLLAVSPDGSQVAVVDGAQLKVWPLRTPGLEEQRRQHQ